MGTHKDYCLDCKRLEAVVALWQEQLNRAMARIADLESECARLKKNSTTSSKPSSSDIVKPPRPPAGGGKRGKRRAGGQPGHARHTRPVFPPEQVDKTRDYEWADVPTGWKALDRFHIVQQVELVEKPYRKFLRETDVWLQLCWAHLIRDVKYLTTLPDRVTRGYGRRLLDKIKGLFRVWRRRGQTPQVRWQRAIAKMRGDVLAVVRQSPLRTEAQNMAKRFRDHGDAYLTFLDTPGIEPTNNGPERHIRFLAIDRKITQGTRGEAGRRWCERIWTILATCAQQGRSAFEFIYHSIVAYFTNHPSPSPLPLHP